MLQNSGTNILECTVCGKKQHSVCYGFLNSHEVESEFYCTECFSDVPHNSSQDVIYTYEIDEQKVNILNIFLPNIHIPYVDIAQILPVFFNFSILSEEKNIQKICHKICVKGLCFNWNFNTFALLKSILLSWINNLLYRIHAYQI